MSHVTGPAGKRWPHMANSEPWTTWVMAGEAAADISQDFRCDALVAFENDRP